MSNSIAARMHGDDYQALFFWLKVCEMLQGHNGIDKVAYEDDKVKAFDDVVVYYESHIYDERTNPIEADYFQLKYHVTKGGSFTWENIMDPKTINASSVSILQRAYQAQKQFAAKDQNIRFYIVTDWNIHPDNQLADIVSNNGGEIRLDKLFKGGSKSQMGRIREAWKQHLGIDTDEELKKSITPIRFINGMTSLMELKDKLNTTLLISGLKPISNEGLTHQYINLVHELMKRGRRQFDRESIIELAKSENLWTGKSLSKIEVAKIGIRSFSRYADYLEDEMDKLICLKEHFDGREVKGDVTWQDIIYPKLENFLLHEATREQIEHHLYLETHASIAFATGRLLEPKSGVNASPVQKSNQGREVWKPEKESEKESDWVVAEEELDESYEDIAVVIAVRHSILEEVKHFIKKNDLPIKKVISVTPGDSPGAEVIKGGRHAWLLADKLATKLNNRSFEDREGHMHIFMSGPNALTFFIGQLSKAFGDLTLYEYDFEKRKPGAYTPSLTYKN